MKKPIIVGFDPGTTAALAILDTKGEILLLKSKRGFKKGEIIDAITRIGKPLIVAGDRYPLPKSVEKLASSLGCRYYHPRKSLSNADKVKLVEDFKERIEDDHERDALASALEAFKAHSSVFERTENILSSLGLSDLYDRIVELVITGKVENITEAINRTLDKMREKRKVPKIKEKVVVKPVSKSVAELQRKIKGLEKDVQILKKYNESLKEKLRDSQERVKYYKKKIKQKLDIDSIGTIKKNMDRLRNELEGSKSLIERLKLFREYELTGFIPIIELDEITLEKVKDLDKKIGLEDRVVLVNNPNNAQILNDYKIKALIAKKEPSERILEKVNFPIIVKEDISIENLKNILVVKRELFEEKLKKARKEGFVQWLSGHKKRKL